MRKKIATEIVIGKIGDGQLTQAQESVTTELRRLDSAMERCLTVVDAEFAEIISKVEKRRAELQAAVTAAARDKKHVLEEQHALIEAEKNKVQRECEGLQYQVRPIIEDEIKQPDSKVVDSILQSNSRF